MGIFKAIGKIAILPITVVADVITLGGGINERNKPYTISLLNEIEKEIEDEIIN